MGQINVKPWRLQIFFRVISGISGQKNSTTPSATDIHQLQQHLRLKHSVLDGKTSEQFKLKKMVWLMFRFLDKMMTFHCQIYDIDQ